MDSGDRWKGIIFVSQKKLKNVSFERQKISKILDFTVVGHQSIYDVAMTGTRYN